MPTAITPIMKATQIGACNALRATDRAARVHNQFRRPRQRQTTGHHRGARIHDQRQGSDSSSRVCLQARSSESEAADVIDCLNSAPVQPCRRGPARKNSTGRDRTKPDDETRANRDSRIMRTSLLFTHRLVQPGVRRLPDHPVTITGHRSRLGREQQWPANLAFSRTFRPKCTQPVNRDSNRPKRSRFRARPRTGKSPRAKRRIANHCSNFMQKRQRQSARFQLFLRSRRCDFRGGLQGWPVPRTRLCCGHRGRWTCFSRFCCWTKVKYQ